MFKQKPATPCCLRHFEEWFRRRDTGVVPGSLHICTYVSLVRVPRLKPLILPLVLIFTPITWSQPCFPPVLLLLARTGLYHPENVRSQRDEKKPRTWAYSSAPFGDLILNKTNSLLPPWGKIHYLLHKNQDKANWQGLEQKWREEEMASLLAFLIFFVLPFPTPGTHLLLQPLLGWRKPGDGSPYLSSKSTKKSKLKKRITIHFSFGTFISCCWMCAHGIVLAKKPCQTQRGIQVRRSMSRWRLASVPNRFLSSCSRPNSAYFRLR